MTHALFRCLTAALAVQTFLAPVMSRAADRAETEGGALRLIVGITDSSHVDAGLAVDLKPGWKTYWRNPGDTGVPPRITLGDSTNVASLDIGYPAPHRFGDPASPSVGYEGRVTLPLKIRLIDPKKPARVALKVFLGICRDICIPVEAELTALIGGPAPLAPAAIEVMRAGGTVPRLVSAGDDLSVAALKWRADGAGLDLEIKAISGQPVSDLFIEGPETWPLLFPERQDGAARWLVSLKGLPEGDIRSGLPLRVTVIAAGRAAEQVVPLPPR